MELQNRKTAYDEYTLTLKNRGAKGALMSSGALDQPRGRKFMEPQWNSAQLAIHRERQRDIIVMTGLEASW